MSGYVGKLLVATPKIVDPDFAGKAVLLLHYEEGLGYEGLIINGKEIGKVDCTAIQAEEINIDPDTIDDMTTEDIKEKILELIGNPNSIKEGSSIFLGGPCGLGSMSMVHGYQDIAADDPTSELVAPGLWTGDQNAFFKIVTNGNVKNGKFKIFSGSSSWFDGQLEEEIEKGAWTVKIPTQDLVFNNEVLEQIIPPSKSFLEKYKPTSN